MPVCWIQDGVDWATVRLDGQAYVLTDNAERPLVPLGDATPLPCQPLLVPGPGGRVENWLLLSPLGTAISINGVVLRLGMRYLRDRDEVLWAGELAVPRRVPPALRLFFSTERLAAVVPLAAGMRPVFCVRCKQLIEPDSAAVQCPCSTCMMWHHQSPELNCWTYAEHCAMCDQPTALDAGYRWTPDLI